jgi:hypothetical protein
MKKAAHRPLTVSIEKDFMAIPSGERASRTLHDDIISLNRHLDLF